MKNTVFEIKNTPEGMNSRLHYTEDQISDLVGKATGSKQAKHQKQKRIF